MRNCEKMFNWLFLTLYLSVCLCHGKSFYVDYEPGLEPENYPPSPFVGRTPTINNNDNNISNMMVNPKIGGENAGGGSTSTNPDISNEIWSSSPLKPRAKKSEFRENNNMTPWLNSNSNNNVALGLGLGLGDADDSEVDNENESEQSRLLFSRLSNANINNNQNSKSLLGPPFSSQWTKVKMTATGPSYKKYYADVKNRKSSADTDSFGRQTNSSFRKRQSILYRQCFFNPISCFR